MRHSAGDVPKSSRTEKLESILEEHRRRKAQGDNSPPDGWQLLFARVAPNNYADKDWTWVPISEHHPLSGCYHQQYIREMRSVIGKLAKRVKSAAGAPAMGQQQADGSPGVVTPASQLQRGPVPDVQSPDEGDEAAAVAAAAEQPGDSQASQPGDSQASQPSGGEADEDGQAATSTGAQQRKRLHSPAAPDSVNNKRARAHLPAWAPCSEEQEVAVDNILPTQFSQRADVLLDEQRSDAEDEEPVQAAAAGGEELAQAAAAGGDEAAGMLCNHETATLQEAPTEVAQLKAKVEELRQVVSNLTAEVVTLRMEKSLWLDPWWRAARAGEGR